MLIWVLAVSGKKQDLELGTHRNAGIRPKKATNVKKDIVRTPAAIFAMTPIMKERERYIYIYHELAQ